MFRWFENRLDPFPAAEPVEPPKTLVAFCLHYTRGAWLYIAATGLLITAIALAEVWMFGFLGIDRRLAFGTEPRRPSCRPKAGSSRAWRSSSLFVLPLMVVRAVADPPADADGQLSDAHPLAGASLSAQAVDDLLPGRVRRPHRHQADADGAGRARVRDEADRRAELRRSSISSACCSSSARRDWRLAVPLVVWLGCYVRPASSTSSRAWARSPRSRPTRAR